jgi:hypothetical protein
VVADVGPVAEVLSSRRLLQGNGKQRTCPMMAGNGISGGIESRALSRAAGFHCLRAALAGFQKGAGKSTAQSARACAAPATGII